MVDGTAIVTTQFNWRNLPDAWVLATSSGTTTTGKDRCQSYTGSWSGALEAIFTGGDFRIHSFQIGKPAAVLAVRGTWTFTDDEVVADLQRVVSIVRGFWHDDRFPYLLVTLKACDQHQGSSNGDGADNTRSSCTLSRREPFSDQLTRLIARARRKGSRGRSGASARRSSQC